jgi:hypothetical protein
VIGTIWIAQIAAAQNTDKNHMKNKNLKLFLFATLAIVALSACGVRPGVVDPPQGKEADKFPQTYPAPENDASGGRYSP